MDKLRIAVIGAGARGVHSFGNLFSARDDCEIAALADTNMERMKAGRAILHKENIALYTDIAKMLAEVKPDAVVVTSVDCFHKEHIIMALRAGFHVLTDKPLATKTADCLEVNRVARETGKTVNMGFNLRSDLVCRKIKELTDSGVIGKLVTIEEREYYSGGKTYFSRWNRFYEKSGGLFCHKGSHDFDIINWLNPGALPVKVSAFAGINVFKPEGLPFKLEPGEEAGPYCEVCKVKDKCPDYWKINPPFTNFSGAARKEDGYNRDTCMYLSEKDTHDNGIAMVEYDNGVRATHSENFISPVGDRLFTIVGDRGHLDASLHDAHVTVRPRWTSDRIEYNLTRPAGGHGGADPAMVETFVRNLKYGKSPVATLRDGTMSVLIAEAAERSRRENRTVMIEEFISRREIEELL